MSITIIRMLYAFLCFDIVNETFFDPELIFFPTDFHAGVLWFFKQSNFNCHSILNLKWSGYPLSFDHGEMSSQEYRHEPGKNHDMDGVEPGQGITGHIFGPPQ